MVLLPAGSLVHFTICHRALQQAPAEGATPIPQAAHHLVSLVMAADADALHHWNQQEWGQRHSSARSPAALQHACCPALWQVHLHITIAVVDCMVV